MTASEVAAGLNAREVLGEGEWRARAEAHRRRLEPVVLPHVARQQRQEKHPVIDFLFQYYSFSPSKLLQWHPGMGVELRGGAAVDSFGTQHGYERTEEGGVRVHAGLFPSRRLAALDWVISLLERTAEREPRFACLGLHEWAMVYRTDGVRHGQLPLRMPPDELAAFVESQAVCCSHYDAFRFFSPAAKPLNRLQPARESMAVFEQRGCVHANMDLYKWAYKFLPWTGGDLVADCFLLAVEARELDMRGSAYDCSGLGLEPLRIETADGRRRFIEWQRDISDRAVPLRSRLTEVLRLVAAGASGR